MKGWDIIPCTSGDGPATGHLDSTAPQEQENACKKATKSLWVSSYKKQPVSEAIYHHKSGSSHRILLNHLFFNFRSHHSLHSPSLAAHSLATLPSAAHFLRMSHDTARPYLMLSTWHQNTPLYCTHNVGIMLHHCIDSGLILYCFG
jgi:hypothetical protein